MTDPTSIDELRKELLRARSGSLGEEMLAFMNVADHPNLEWQDLLDALSRPGIIAEDSALRLHKLLSVPREDIQVNTSPDFWVGKLNRLGIQVSDKVSAIAGTPSPQN